MFSHNAVHLYERTYSSLISTYVFYETHTKFEYGCDLSIQIRRQMCKRTKFKIHLVDQLCELVSQTSRLALLKELSLIFRNIVFRATKLACNLTTLLATSDFVAMIARDVQQMGLDHMSLVLRKPVFGVSDQVRYKPGCTATEDG